MAIVEALQKAIEYMEAHLLEDITIKDIAAQAHMSSYHFQRTFVILTDITVGEYLRRRRLTKAAHELCNTNAKIIDIAYKYGYQTPESFSKAFQRQHGLTPSDARKGIGNLQSYNRLTIQVNLKGVEPMKYHMMERDDFQIVGVKESFECNETFDQSKEINRFWSQLGQGGTIDQLLRLNHGEIAGLIGATIAYHEENDQMEYMVAVESSSGDIPDGLFKYELPSTKWVIFEAAGPVMDVVPKLWKQIYSEWFPSNDYEHSGAPSLEVYTSPDPTSSTAKTEIWVPVK
ncbi:GyrI-like domain-containing protein [Aliibacillus thermotolerans]|uniref:GyrI-like domain-containing protein n=1 Tax=Aliibacillus thermotolerans TaxID=1834418 RepID=A0ABW0U3M8_9BACI|nr:AraC family transcriptional regulator [Aliibacillus thermotolerans]MDA3129445.1 helix-turn-helix domain-containing protein [Aliibacillus thermotolerans]